jgi:hypothetical protein
VEDQLKPPVVIIGIGEMAGVFARGLLRLGHPVYPVTRQSGDLASLARAIPVPTMVLVAVGESDLATVLEAMPEAWRDRLALLQNELLPGNFAALTEPTVISVWFEKKKGQDARVIVPSPVYGPRATLLVDALAKLDIPATPLGNPDDLLFELVVKNLYILVSNIAGLKTGGTVGTLWADHEAFAREVAADVIALQEGLTGTKFDQERLIQAMLEAFEGDPDHKCMGRSAPQRLARALAHADGLALEVPTMRAISRETGDA